MVLEGTPSRAAAPRTSQPRSSTPVGYEDRLCQNSDMSAARAARESTSNCEKMRIDHTNSNEALGSLRGVTTGIADATAAPRTRRRAQDRERSCDQLVVSNFRRCTAATYQDVGRRHGISPMWKFVIHDDSEYCALTGRICDVREDGRDECRRT